MLVQKSERLVSILGSIQRCTSFEIHLHPMVAAHLLKTFKGGTTIKNLLVASKDQDPMKKRSGVIYRYKCNRVECDDEYIGESLRTFGERFKEHLKAPSPIFDHYKTTGRQVSIENFSIVGREEQNLMRAIREALYIRVNNPSLNRNIGKYHLPHIWDEVLFNTSELKLK